MCSGNKQANSFPSVHLSPILALCSAHLATWALGLSIFITKQWQRVICLFLLSNLLGAISDPVTKVKSSRCMNSHVLSPSLLQRCLSLQQFGLFILSNKRKRQQVHTSKNNFLCVFKCPPSPRCYPLQTSQIHRFTQNTMSTKNMVYWTGLNDAMLRHCICINNALAEKHKMILFFLPLKKSQCR